MKELLYNLLMIIAVDTGGTKTLVALFDEQGMMVQRSRFETPKDYPAYLRELRSSLQPLLKMHSVRACVIAMPGRIDADSGSVVAFGNLPWKNVRIGNDLGDILQHRPLYLLNDAKLAGLAAAIAAPHYRRALYITVSTGIGTCFVVDGKIDTILANSEAGQAEVEHDGALEKWEHFASGSAIVRDYGKRASDIDDPVAWKEIAHKICLGLFELNAILQPDVVLFGGGVGAHLSKYKAYIEAELDAHPNPLVNRPVIEEAQHAEDAVLYGGYFYAVQQQEL
jgi:glucokinase